MTVEVSDLLEKTNIVMIVLQILSVPTPSDGESVMMCIQLEAGWILTNIAYGSDAQLSTLLEFSG